MNIDFTQIITDLDGNPVLESEATPLTLRKVAINSLLGTFTSQGGQPEQQSGETKVRLASLAQRIHSEPSDATLTIEEAALIKERIGKAYAALVVMRAWNMLETS